MKARCLYCNVEFAYSPSQSTGKYCSNRCQGLYKVYNDTVPRIERGEVNQTNTLRRYLKEIKNCVCAGCGLSDTYNGKPITLQVDHIDGNSDNNFPNNLRLLCPNCHSQTESWAGRNKKSAKRNVYLQKYKSGRYKNGRVA
jgi:5-methylcytosine-specific restriction endonuclease McrA